MLGDRGTASTAPPFILRITTSRSARCRGLRWRSFRPTRDGWAGGFPWASTFEGDFNYDFQAAITKEQWQSGDVEYNFHRSDFRPAAGQDSSGLDEFASSKVGTDWETYRREGPGVSAFALEDGVVYHTYSAYARGLDGLWGMYQWLDRAPLGRNETGFWWRRHDEYDGE